MVKEPFYKMLDAGLDNTSYTIETGSHNHTNHKSQHTSIIKTKQHKKEKGASTTWGQHR